MEIGGYMELEHFPQKPWYRDLYELNLGRTALTLYLKAVHCKTLFVPCFLCDSVIEECKKNDIPLVFYTIDRNLSPQLDRPPAAGEYLYLVNYYGQLSDHDIIALKSQYQNIIVDHTHAFFQRPLKDVPTIYSVRKFFGVSDGAYLACPEEIDLPREVDCSRDRMGHLLGRYETTASEFYQTMLSNAHAFHDTIPMRMSPLTKNILGAIDYHDVRRKRSYNYRYLSERLENNNIMNRNMPDGPFAYPFYCKNGTLLRKRLAKRKIYIPTYWSNVIEAMPKGSPEYDFSANILPLPCDQRYDRWAMEHLADCVLEELQILEG